jgi:hypothetical protein
MKDLTYEEVLNAVRYCSSDYYDKTLAVNIAVLRANARLLFDDLLDGGFVYRKQALIGHANEKYREMVKDAFLELEMSAA